VSTFPGHALAHQPVERPRGNSTQQKKKSEKKDGLGDQGDELHGFAPVAVTSMRARHQVEREPAEIDSGVEIFDMPDFRCVFEPASRCLCPA
jgi:hypothetical protein